MRLMVIFLHSSSKNHDGRYQKFADVSDTVVEEFKALMSNPPVENEIRNDSLIAGSMAVALCCELT